MNKNASYNSDGKLNLIMIDYKELKDTACHHR